MDLSFLTGADPMLAISIGTLVKAIVDGIRAKWMRVSGPLTLAIAAILSQVFVVAALLAGGAGMTGETIGRAVLIAAGAYVIAVAISTGQSAAAKQRADAKILAALAQRRAALIAARDEAARNN